ncbi:MAG TPA: hypothetical protein VFK24_01060 [Gammaproteobacteria bacterium]|nr:hypothetical protein [Gammaproteobacteria bacterium]
MDIIKATVVSEDGNRFIRIGVGTEQISIPISDDKPNAVKSAFNKLVTRIKAGVFEIKLEEVGEDLFSQVAGEYVAQLNREIREIHGEMEAHDLL